VLSGTNRCLADPHAQLFARHTLDLPAMPLTATILSVLPPHAVLTPRHDACKIRESG